MTTEFKNIVWKEGQHYVALCLNVEVSSFGDTKEEALENLKEAIELYLEDTPIEGISKIDDPEIVYAQIEHA
ncbi:MAG: type II toxin-antitoxin system HicB family antitoxin [Ginsengibacter sp.]